MTDKPKQLPLELPHRTALSADSFLISGSNQAAVAFIERWPDWPSPIILIHGPKGAGKTHLIAVWQARSNAECIAGASLADTAIASLDRAGALAVDDIEQADGNRERQLFHVMNHAREIAATVLLTASRPPSDIDVKTPDLRSRLRAIPSIALGQPDDALLQAVLVKLFADRQILVEPSVLQYLARHMERSAEAALSIVDEIDRRSLADRRRITARLAGEVLAARAAETID